MRPRPAGASRLGDAEGGQRQNGPRVPGRAQTEAFAVSPEPRLGGSLPRPAMNRGTRGGEIPTSTRYWCAQTLLEVPANQAKTTKNVALRFHVHTPSASYGLRPPLTVAPRSALR